MPVCFPDTCLAGVEGSGILSDTVTSSEQIPEWPPVQPAPGNLSSFTRTEPSPPVCLHLLSQVHNLPFLCCSCYWTVSWVAKQENVPGSEGQRVLLLPSEMGKSWIVSALESEVGAPQLFLSSKVWFCLVALFRSHHKIFFSCALNGLIYLSSQRSPREKAFKYNQIQISKSKEMCFADRRKELRLQILIFAWCPFQNVRCACMGESKCVFCSCNLVLRL